MYKVFLKWKEPNVIRRHARGRIPAVRFYLRIFLKTSLKIFISVVLGLLLVFIVKGFLPDIIALLLCLMGSMCLGLFITMITWAFSFVYPEIQFCEDHIKFINLAGIVRLKYADIRGCRFRMVTVGDRKIDVLDIQVAEGFRTVEINPKVSRSDIKSVLKQKRVTVG